MMLKSKHPEVKTPDEIKALVAEYRALPDDLTTRLNWSGSERLPHLQLTCKECGAIQEDVLVNMGELCRMADREDYRLNYRGFCAKCAPADEEEATE